MFRSKNRKEKRAIIEEVGKLRAGRYPLPASSSIHYPQPNDFCDAPRPAPRPMSTPKVIIVPDAARDASPVPKSANMYRASAPSVPRRRPVPGQPSLLSLNAMVDAPAISDATKQSKRTSTDMDVARWHVEALAKDESSAFVQDMQRALSECSTRFDDSSSQLVNQPDTALAADASRKDAPKMKDKTEPNQVPKLQLKGDIRLAGSSGPSPLVAQYKRKRRSIDLPKLQMRSLTSVLNSTLDVKDERRSSKVPPLVSPQRQSTLNPPPLPSRPLSSFETRLDALQSRFDALQAERLAAREESLAQSQTTRLISEQVERHEVSLAQHGTRIDSLEIARTKEDKRLVELESQIALCKSALALLRKRKAGQTPPQTGTAPGVAPLRIHKQPASLIEYRALKRPPPRDSLVSQGKLPASAEYRAAKEKARRKDSMLRYKQECMAQLDRIQAEQDEWQEDEALASPRGALSTLSVSRVSNTGTTYSLHSDEFQGPIVPRGAAQSSVTDQEEEVAVKQEVQSPSVTKAERIYFRPVKITSERPTHILTWQKRKP